MSDFLTDVKTLRERAREKIEEGPVTAAYGADRDRVVEVLNEALATELVCYLRYKRHYFMADGINAAAAAAEFLEHANQELGHADQLAARITQLQGEPNFSPDTLTARSHAEYVEGDDLVSMIKEDLIAERIAIESYQEIARWLGDKDSTTRRLMEEILAVEEEHADDLLSLLTKMASARPAPGRGRSRGSAGDDVGPDRARCRSDRPRPPSARLTGARPRSSAPARCADRRRPGSRCRRSPSHRRGARPSGSRRRAP